MKKCVLKAPANDVCLCHLLDFGHNGVVKNGNALIIHYVDSFV